MVSRSENVGSEGGYLELLQLLIDKYDTFNENSEPLWHFCKQQIVRSARALLRAIQETGGTTSDHYEICDNLQKLHKFVIDQGCSQPLADKLYEAIFNMASVAEKSDKFNYLDWSQVYNLSSRKSTGENIGLYDIICKYIPKMEDLQKVRLIGQGSFGTLYHVNYTTYGLSCALKLIPRNRLDITTVAKEKVVASVIGSPFLMTYYACFCTAEAFASLMEYAEGVDLSDATQQYKGRWPIEEVKLIMAQLILALQHMHFRGIIHNDIKCENVMIFPSGRIKLIDYDLSLVCMGHFLKRGINTFFRLTRRELKPGFSGCKWYMAPEKFLQQQYGRAVDWWSVGVLCHVLLMGSLPFGDDNVHRRFFQAYDERQHFVNKLDAMNSRSPEIADFILNLLKKNPSKRLGSRSYDDVTSHPIFSDVDWDQLYEPQIFRSRDIDALCGGKIIRTIFRRNERTDKPAWIELDEVHDAAQEHRRLFTLATLPYKRLIETFWGDWKQQPQMTREEKYNLLQYEENREFGYEPGVEDPDSILTSNILQQIDQATIALEVKLSKGIIKGIEDAGIQYALVVSPFFQRFLMVTRIDPGSPASQAEFIEGDIIAYINQKAAGSPLKALLTKILSIQVYLQNPFRIAATTRNLWNLLNQTDVYPLKLISNYARPSRETGQPSHYFEIKSVPHDVFDGIDSYVTVHIIKGLGNRTAVAQGFEGIYAGDVLMSFAGISTVGMNNTTLQSMLWPHTSREADAEICPLSILRKLPNVLPHYGSIQQSVSLQQLMSSSDHEVVPLSPR